MVTSEPTLVAYLPDRLERAKPGSRIGVLHARWLGQLVHAGEAMGALRALEERRDACTALIERATPEADFVAVAAATAALPVLERHIGWAKDEYKRRAEPAAFTLGEAQRLFNDYGRLRRVWRREFYLEDKDADRYRAPEELARLIAELVGAAGD